uniref:Uncharacterized protein n=1 Tax=Cucumis sativus TaxID=3659 RepID=A0A0A0L2V3_CUCSA
MVYIYIERDTTSIACSSLFLISLFFYTFVLKRSGFLFLDIASACGCDFVFNPLSLPLFSELGFDSDGCERQ